MLATVHLRCSVHSLSSLESMAPTIAIVGMGAIGGYVGGMLTKAGVDVTFVESWQPHIDAVRANGGLLVKDARAGEFLVPVKVLAISELATNRKLFDYCIIAMKSYDTEWAATLMELHVKESGAFISIQNGINDYRLAAAVNGGASRCIGCVTTVGNGCLTPGEVARLLPPPAPASALLPLPPFLPPPPRRRSAASRPASPRPPAAGLAATADLPPWHMGRSAGTGSGTASSLASTTAPSPGASSSSRRSSTSRAGCREPSARLSFCCTPIYC